MSGVIDTNILLYAANSDCDENRRARDFIYQVQSSPGLHYLTEGICYEFLRVSTHQRVFPSPLKASQAMAFLEVMLESDNIRLLTAGSRHWKCLRAVLNDQHAPMGNLMFDIRTVTLMQEHGIRRIYSADTDFLQFKGIEWINPIIEKIS